MSKILRIGISAILFSFVAWRTDWSEVAQRFAGMHAAWWCAAWCLLLVGLFGSVLRWQFYGRELGFEHSWAQFCAFYFVGMFFNLVLPTSVGGDVVRAASLHGPSGRKWPAFASVLLERANSLLVLIVIAGLGLGFFPFALPAWIVVGVWSSAAAAAGALLALRYAEKMPLLSPGRREQLRQVTNLFCSPRLWLGTTLLSVFTQVAGILSVWCLAMSVGIDMPLAYACIFTPLLTLLMLLPISVGGMGVREGGTIVLLAPLGVDTASALTLAFLLFSVVAATSLIGGGVYLLGPITTPWPARRQEAG